MKRIEKKILPEYFQAVLDGRKTYELRLNDFDIEEGDMLVLKEWSKEAGKYTGREVEKTVGFVRGWKLKELEDFWTKEDIEKFGLQVISLKDQLSTEQ
jgi:ASC-1-like (ASCH) protein